MKRATLIYFLSDFTFSICCLCTIQVKGKVIDDKKSELPGVSILISRDILGNYSDVSGNYYMLVDTHDTLISP